VYLLLAIRQRLECWIAAFVSSCLYVWVFFGARLYMESVLNAFYAGMAVYGFWQWQQGRAGAALAVSRWPIARHAAGFVGVAALSAISWYFLRRFTPAAWPFMDSMVTWSSVFATFLVARKVYENWHWWLVIDSVSLCLYFFATFVSHSAAFRLVPCLDRGRHAAMAPHAAGAGPCCRMTSSGSLSSMCRARANPTSSV